MSAEASVRIAHLRHAERPRRTRLSAAERNERERSRELLIALYSERLKSLVVDVGARSAWSKAFDKRVAFSRPDASLFD